MDWSWQVQCDLVVPRVPVPSVVGYIEGQRMWSGPNFRPTSVQFKGRINRDKARKRHQTRHLEVYTTLSRTRRASQAALRPDRKPLERKNSPSTTIRLA